MNLDKVRIPQADEQQRLLANLIIQMNLDRTPLPRFWYLPNGHKAAVVMTGDDHGAGGVGTNNHLDRLRQEDPPNCSVADWQCVRATSYAFSGISIPGATSYQAAGFEIGLHLSTSCSNFTPASIAVDWNAQLAEWRGRYARDHQPADEPDALHRLERLGHRGDRGARTRHPARHELLLLARIVDQPSAGHVHRLRVPAAVRRPPERQPDRRLPGDDPADGRVGNGRGHPDPHQVAARRRDQLRLLRGVHGQHAYGPGAVPARRHAVDRRRGPAPRRPGGLRRADARLARRPQRLVVPEHELRGQPPAVLGHRRGGLAWPAGHAARRARRQVG